MPLPPAISAAQRDRIVALGHAGTPRNQIAREVGVSVGTVTKYCKQAGVSFDRRRTAAATAAAAVDSAEKRVSLSVDLLTRIAAAVEDISRAIPANMREHEQRARALLSLGASFATVSRAAPVVDGTGEEVREALREFRDSLREKHGDGDTYGQVEAPEETADAEA